MASSPPTLIHAIPRRCHFASSPYGLRMASRDEKRRRILLTIESGVSYKALRRVTQRLANEEGAVEDVLDPASIERALEEEYGPQRQVIRLSTDDGKHKGSFEWEVGGGAADPPTIFAICCFGPVCSQYACGMWGTITSTRGIE